MTVRRILIALVGMALLSAPCSAMETCFDTGINTTVWQNDNDDHGLQVAIPILAGITQGNFRVKLLNALVYTSVDPDGGDKASLTHFLDTKLDLSYVSSGRLPFDLLVGCGFNLPTGYTRFKDDDMALLTLPPDLLPITTFGEGFNVNPYFGMSKEWNRVVAGFGIGYLLSGKYDYSETVQDYDPGDILTVTASVGYDFTPAFQGKLFGEYATYGKDTVDGDDYFQDGDLFLVGLGLTYSPKPSWNLSGRVHAIYRSKAEYFSAAGAPVNNEKNYGDEWEALLNYQYFLNSRTSILTGIDYLYIGQNDYPKTSAFYAGKRQKITLSGGMERSFTEKVKGTLHLDLFSLDDDRNWYHPADDLRYTGLNLSAGLQARF